MEKNTEVVAYLRTTDYRGDHAAEVTRTFNVPVDMTIGELLQKVNLGQDGNQKYDWVELRHSWRLEKENS